MENNLLNITTVPIAIEVNIVKGGVHNSDSPEIAFETSPGNHEYNIKAKPVKINVDTFIPKGDTEKTPYSSTSDKGKNLSLSYKGIAKIISEPDPSSNTVAVQDINNIHRAGVSIQSVMESLPKKDALVTYDGEKLNIDYNVEDNNLDWKAIENARLQFTPGSIEFIIKERPRIEIEYTGDPIYVPASADPNYDPPKTVFDKSV